jgi:hypothetical protein
MGLGTCRDCFWDDNVGSGDDDCRYDVTCLSGQAPSGKGKCATCDVSAACIDRCLTRTPNGCDCFGCCQVTRPDGSLLLIALNETCSLANIDNTQACPRCVQSSACSNPCGRCELCAGRTQANLPTDCGDSQTNGSQGYACDDGQQVCSSAKPCNGTEYCQLGCCLPTVF